MNSKVLKLYDWKLVEIPEEMKDCQVGEDQVEEALYALTRKYAKETQAETVCPGDTVFCKCEEGSLKGRLLLFYPGLSLPGAKEAEELVLSHKKGDRFPVRVNGEEQILVMEQILRRESVALDDALVCREALDDVRTVEDYQNWYRERKAAENREEAAGVVGYFLMKTVTDRSEYAIDKQEMYDWTLERAKQEYEESIAMGEDPHIPDEGVEFLSDEEALERIRKAMERQFQNFLVAEAFCRQHGMEPDPDDIQFQVNEAVEAEIIGKDPAEQEAYRKQEWENEWMFGMLKFLCGEAEALLEAEMSPESEKSGQEAEHVWLS